ncbi:hypothetical protein TNCV_1781751 [Trichonephila clavipes]|nr:hypothetical protein TNCV_1781751 [Trichonephila clavipes]
MVTSSWLALSIPGATQNPCRHVKLVEAASPHEGWRGSLEIGKPARLAQNIFVREETTTILFDVFQWTSLSAFSWVGVVTVKGYGGEDRR